MKWKSRWLRRGLLALSLLLPCTVLASSADLSSAMTRQLKVNEQRYGIAGQTVLVAHDGAVLFRGAEGYADVDTHRRLKEDDIFPVYSVSKLLVSTLVMQLVDQGQVNLDKPASDYVPGLPTHWRLITVREFLDHTSGIPEYYDGAGLSSPETLVFPTSRQAALSSLADKPLLFPSGTDSHYTQAEYLVLSALLEAHYGKPYSQIVDERIFRKLHLEHTWLGPAGVPKRDLVTAYLGKDGRLEEAKPIGWPTYSYVHTELYSTVDDLSHFLRALTAGELVSKATLQQLWQIQTLANGRRGWFSAGWDYQEHDGYREVGHDGGTKVRASILFRQSLDNDVYVIVYLTNGSAKNIWSQVLINSVMATVAPDRFPAEVLSDELIGYALSPAKDKDAIAQARWIQQNSPLRGEALEHAVEDAADTIGQNFNMDAAIRAYHVDTLLFPESAAAWNHLAQAYAANGDKEKAAALYDKARKLPAPSTSAKLTNP